MKDEERKSQGWNSRSPLDVLLCAEMRCEGDERERPGNLINQSYNLVRDVRPQLSIKTFSCSILLSRREYSVSRLNSSFHQLKVAQLSTYRPSRALICFH